MSFKNRNLLEISKKRGLWKFFGPILGFYTKNSPRNSWSSHFMITLWNQKSRTSVVEFRELGSKLSFAQIFFNQKDLGGFWQWKLTLKVTFNESWKSNKTNILLEFFLSKLYFLLSWKLALLMNIKKGGSNLHYLIILQFIMSRAKLGKKYRVKLNLSFKFPYHKIFRD